MRHIPRVIVLAISVAGLASCAKTSHSMHWYEQHKNARDAMLNKCADAHIYGAASDPDCTPALEAHHAIVWAVHSAHWYEQHKRAESAMADRCSYGAHASRPDCVVVDKIENAKVNAYLNGAFKGLGSYSPPLPGAQEIPPGHASAHGG